MKKIIKLVGIIVLLAVVVFSMTGCRYVPEDECGECDGSGKCEVCRGTGKDYSSDYPFKKCWRCNGSGKCFYCDGTGKIDGHLEWMGKNETIKNIYIVKNANQHITGL
jgi:hypothetical protein